MPNVCRDRFSLNKSFVSPAQTLRSMDTTAYSTRFLNHLVIKETIMQWTTPAYSDLRFGFEITMYIANR
jgi:coenzyme PQQ precursor peptide PqqA